MKKIPSLLLTMLLAFSSRAQNNILESKAPQELTLFGRGWISTHIQERDFAISPNGKEIFYTIATPRSDLQTIVYTRQDKNGKWSKPEVASFVSAYSDLEPAFSADGQTLYFSSNRPLEGNEAKDFDIWFVKRTGESWSEAVNVGAPINTVEDEFYPSIAKSGNLYFTASYSKGGKGREDIYCSHFKNNQFEIPLSLDSAINSKFDEFNAFVSAKEDYLIFTCYGRKDDFGGGDLYISVKNELGNWTKAKNIKEVNSSFLEYCPFVSTDGSKLFLTSNRYTKKIARKGVKLSFQEVLKLWETEENSFSNIYWIDFQSVLKNYLEK